MKELNKQELTWDTNRPSDANIISMNYISLNNLDTMLINQANCQAVESVDIDFSDFKKNIIVYGTRTSASDTAVQTLKEKGYTVMVNGVTL